MGKQGFTILEVLLIATIIAIVMAIAIPMLLKSKIPANEVATQQTLKAVATSEILYRRYHEQYGTMDELIDEQYINDETLRTSVKAGYVYELTVQGMNSWYAEARPDEYLKTGIMTFYVDETLVIREKDLLESAFKDRLEACRWDEVD